MPLLDFTRVSTLKEIVLGSNYCGIQRECMKMWPRPLTQICFYIEILGKLAVIIISRVVIAL